MVQMLKIYTKVTDINGFIILLLPCFPFTLYSVYKSLQDLVTTPTSADMIASFMLNLELENPYSLLVITMRIHRLEDAAINSNIENILDCSEQDNLPIIRLGQRTRNISDI